MKKGADEMMDLFEYMNENGIDGGFRIEVVKLDYVQSELLTWKELFSGFDKIYAITFSSGLGFVGELLDLFSYAEIIFGCEDVMSLGIKEIMAYQDTLIERIRGDKHGIKDKMIERIQSGTAHFYVAEKVVSHEKIYLLEGEDGKKRVVMGSANMSYNAFGGKQRENISYMDGDAAFDYYLDVYHSLKEDSVDEISRKALEYADLSENIDAIPFSETVKTKGIVAIESEKREEVKFILDVSKKSEKLAPHMPKPEKKSAKTLISADVITKIRRHLVEEKKKEQDLRSEYPQLVINVLENNASLNGEELDLEPKEEEIRNDVELFLKYMNGYSKFHGDVAGLQLRYFEFANWFFCSPFMATMRDMAARYDRNRLPYPVFGLLYGQSKAGKTTFLETLLKMMIGQKPKVSAPDFTRSGIEALKNTVMGAPIIVDDLTNTRFNQHAVETIKNDDFGVAGHLTNYSAVVISANEDVKAVASEIIRRTVICRVEAGLTNTEVMRDNIVRTVQQKIGTAFYREYMRRMMEVVQNLLEELKKDDAENTPDILNHSSGVIVDILKEYSDKLPEYIRKLSFEDYFGERVTGKYAIKTIQNAWKTSRGSFKILKRSNELRYNAGAPYEADRIMKELPENLEAHKSREWIVMNLEEARKYFEMTFKKGIL
ncbi:MAG: NgoFVII family restriction endonuclease [Lachnospiraceae bacterium]|nr:NgoFVII family restriction endonuclease [Lachnospiraceae bacterium]